MKYTSTRGGGAPLSFSQALQAGLAPDGGLYVPERLPAFAPGDFSAADTLEEIGVRVLAPFFEGDPLAGALREIARAAFNFPTPLVRLDETTSVLELFHGPTAAFKDVGARFLAECVSRQPVPANRRRTVLVATSGDTGGAVAGAFFGRPGIEVVILFPKGRISPRQELQLTAWGGNIRAYAVRGSFDDCQRMVKAALLDNDILARHALISANSISMGRILPQALYYAQASLRYLRATGARAGFVVPSGNLGNSVGAFWARRMGFPIREIVLACNANRSVPDFLATGVWSPQATIATLANAMDVGNPSNIERIRSLYSQADELRREVRAFSVSDDEIRGTISAGRWNQVWCPHTATAVNVHGRLSAGHWILVATAHPAKFDTIVEPLVGRRIAVPPALAALLSREGRSTELTPTPEALRAELLKG